MAKNIKQKTNFKKDDIEKKILDVEDLIMQVCAYKGITSYEVPDLLKNWREVKSSLKYCIEDIMNIKGEPDNNLVEADNSEYIRLNLKSDKKYTF